MESVSVNLSDVSKLHPGTWAEPRISDLPPAPKPVPTYDQKQFAKNIYGFLTAVFASLGLGLFFYFAYCTCGAAGILIASSVFLLAAGAFIRYVLLY